MFKKIIKFVLNWIAVMSMFSAIYCADGADVFEKVTNAISDTSISYESELTKIESKKIEEALKSIKG